MQCSEICGVYHGFMPICVESKSLYDYLTWLYSLMIPFFIKNKKQEQQKEEQEINLYPYFPSEPGDFFYYYPYYKIFASVVSRAFYITLLFFNFFLACYFFNIFFSFNFFNFSIGFTEDSFLFNFFDSINKYYWNSLVENTVSSPSYLNDNNGSRFSLTVTKNPSSQVLNTLYASKDKLEEMVYDGTLNNRNRQLVWHHLRPLYDLGERFHIQEVYATAWYDGSKEAVRTLNSFPLLNSKGILGDFRKELFLELISNNKNFNLPKYNPQLFDLLEHRR